MNSPEIEFFTANEHIHDTKQTTDHGVEIKLQVRPFFKHTQYFAGKGSDIPLFTSHHVQRFLGIGSIEHDRNIHDVIRDHISKLQYGIDYITISNKRFKDSLITLSKRLIELNNRGLISNSICTPLHNPFTIQFSEKPIYLFTSQGITRFAEIESQSIRETITDRVDFFIPMIQSWYRDYLQAVEEQTNTLRD